MTRSTCVWGRAIRWISRLPLPGKHPTLHLYRESLVAVQTESLAAVQGERGKEGEREHAAHDLAEMDRSSSASRQTPLTLPSHLRANVATTLQKRAAIPRRARI